MPLISLEVSNPTHLSATDKNKFPLYVLIEIFASLPWHILKYYSTAPALYGKALVLSFYQSLFRYTFHQPIHARAVC